MKSGKTTEDFLRAIESPSDGQSVPSASTCPVCIDLCADKAVSIMMCTDPIERDIYMVKTGKTFLPERYFSFGLCKLMEACNVEVTWESIKVRHLHTTPSPRMPRHETHVMCLRSICRRGPTSWAWMRLGRSSTGTCLSGPSRSLARWSSS